MPLPSVITPSFAGTQPGGQDLASEVRDDFRIVLTTASSPSTPLERRPRCLKKPSNKRSLKQGRWTIVKSVPWTIVPVRYTARLAARIAVEADLNSAVSSPGGGKLEPTPIVRAKPVALECAGWGREGER